VGRMSWRHVRPEVAALANSALLIAWLAVATAYAGGNGY